MAKREGIGEVVPPRVAELLEGREEVRGWLEALEERRGDVREEVYRRVETDYLERLEEVESELLSHGSDLGDALQRRRSRVEELESEREARAAELEEAELRHAVGEYSGEEWTELREERREAIAEVDGRLEAEREAAGRVREILAELEALEPGTAPGGEPASARTSPHAGAASGPEASADVEAGKPAEGRAEDGEEEAAPHEEETTAPAEEAAAREEEPAVHEEEAAVHEEELAKGEEGPTDREEEAAEAERADDLDFLEALTLDEPDSLDTFAFELEDEEGEERGSGG